MVQISLERDAGRQGRPVYRQIADQIRAQIAAEGLAAGSRLPPIRELARELRVNRDTVALAYGGLSRPGVVELTVRQRDVCRRRELRRRPAAPRTRSVAVRAAPAQIEVGVGASEVARARRLAPMPAIRISARSPMPSAARSTALEEGGPAPPDGWHRAIPRTGGQVLVGACAGQGIEPTPASGRSAPGDPGGSRSRCGCSPIRATRWSRFPPTERCPPRGSAWA